MSLFFVILLIMINVIFVGDENNWWLAVSVFAVVNCVIWFFCSNFVWLLV